MPDGQEPVKKQEAKETPRYLDRQREKISQTSGGGLTRGAERKLGGFPAPQIKEPLGTKRYGVPVNHR